MEKIQTVQEYRNVMAEIENYLQKGFQSFRKMKLNGLKSCQQQLKTGKKWNSTRWD